LSDLRERKQIMLQAVSGFYLLTRSEDEDAMPIRGHRRQRIDMTRRTMRDYGHLLDQDTRNRVQAELTDAEGYRFD
jgi:hypothetical protein